MTLFFLCSVSAVLHATRPRQILFHKILASVVSCDASFHKRACFTSLCRRFAPYESLFPAKNSVYDTVFFMQCFRDSPRNSSTSNFVSQNSSVRGFV
ncbi:MAG: hypothetical protein RR405_05350 [Clostridia bacterium]